MGRTDKEIYRVIDNVNSYYRINSESKKELLLNKYPNAAAAYSLRLLDGYYRGPLVRVRRDDGVEVDVYPDYNNQLSLDSLVTNVPDADDTTTNPDINADATFLKSLQSLGEFVSNPNYVDGGTAVDATVCVWYDQSSTDGVANANDAKQVTATDQPLIVSGGVVVTENGRPAVNFDGSNDFITPVTSTASDYTMHAVTLNTRTFGSYLFDSQSGRLIFDVRGTSVYFDGTHRGSRHTGTTQQLQSIYAVAPSNGQSYVNGTQINTGLGYVQKALGGTTRLGGAYYGDARIIGTMQEFVLYASDQSTNRTGIEEDINNHYQIEGYEPQQPLIDLTQALAVQGGGTTADGTPAAAYSLRTLSSTYTGPLVRVRRSTDNVEVDVYADSEGSFSLLSPITDGGNEQSSPYLGNSSVGSTTKTKLYEFVYGQGCDLTVVTWYDQASGNNATQTTTGSQPKIYDSATGVVTENGKSAVQFDGSDDYLTATMSATDIISTNAENTVAAVLNQDSASTDNRLASNESAGPNWALFTDQNGQIAYNGGNNSTNRIQQNTPANWEDNQHLIFFSCSLTYQQIAIDGTVLVSNSLQDTLTGSSTVLQIGRQYTIHQQGTVQEFLLYNTDKSSNRTGIESNINQHYNIY